MANTLPLDDFGGDFSRLHRYVRARIRHLSSVSPLLERDDLEQEAWLGILAAAARYEAGHGGTFSTYAYRRVRGRALDAIRPANLDVERLPRRYGDVHHDDRAMTARVTTPAT